MLLTHPTPRCPECGSLLTAELICPEGHTLSKRAALRPYGQVTAQYMGFSAIMGAWSVSLEAPWQAIIGGIGACALLVTLLRIGRMRQKLRDSPER